MLSGDVESDEAMESGSYIGEGLGNESKIEEGSPPPTGSEANDEVSTETVAAGVTGSAMGGVAGDAGDTEVAGGAMEAGGSGKLPNCFKMSSAVTKG